MSGGVELRGFDEFLRCIEDSPDKLERSVILRAHKLAEDVAGQARQGAPVKDGRLRNSLQSFTESRGGEIVGGVRTSYDVAIFHELGTGPVGNANPHPAEAELNPKRRPDGWKYQSAEVAAKRGEEFVPYVKGVQAGKGGYVYTEGIKAKAFMYNALKASEDKIMESLGAAIEEAMDAEVVRE